MHPSLTSPNNFTTLNPVEKPNDPYSLCWCGSGKKWKFCHKDRSTQKAIHLKEYQSLIRKNYNQGICLHPDASLETCSIGTISSHTIQMSGGISSITKDNHVYTFKTLDSIEDEIFHPKKIGQRRASTFLGFCNKHDTELFKPIETHPLKIDKTAFYYMSFRAISYEYHGKLRALSAANIMEKQDSGMPFPYQASLQWRLHIAKQGHEKGFQIHKKIKRLFDESHSKNDHSNFKYYAIEFEKESPVVACGSFCPEHDINGKPLQKLAQGEVDFQVITFNLLNINSRAYAVFGWINDDYHVARDYIESIKEHPTQILSDLAVRIAFQNLENTYIFPDWWDQLEESAQENICSLFRSGLWEIPKESEDLHFESKIWPASVSKVFACPDNTIT